MSTQIPEQFRSGPFGYRDARDQGVSVAALRHPRWFRPFVGVRTALPPLTIDEMARSYAVRMPPHAFFCGPTAALLWGAPMPAAFDIAGPLHVGVAAPARAVRCAGVVGRKIKIESSDVVTSHGLRLTTPERTWCDLAPQLTRDDIVAAGDFFIRRESPLTAPEALRTVLSRHPSRRGRPALTAALSLLDAGAESRQESILRLVLIDAGLAPVKANASIRTLSGHLYRADLLLPEVRTIVEYQSEYHADIFQFRADMTRRSRLEADGWNIVYVNADDLRDTRELVDRLRALIARHTPATSA